MQRIVILFLVLIALIGASLTYVYWPSIQHTTSQTFTSINKLQNDQDLQKTKEFLKNGRPEEAIAIIQTHADSIDNHTDEGKEWLELLIRASAATVNVPQLVVLYDYHSKAFDSNEKAALLVANQLIATNRSHDYRNLRDGWKGRETQPEVWFVLDSDQLLLDAKRKEAIEFLNSRSFPGKSDSARLVRLALLHVYEDPKVAWDYLNQAYAKDPENSDIRSYRAKLLETVGKLPLALAEYQAASQIDPKNLFLKDQLAEYYVRTNQYSDALKLWLENLNPPSLDIFWLKALFWSRVAKPVIFDWHAIQPPKGQLEPLIGYLLNLPQGTFWDAVAFERIPEGQSYLKTQQVTFWLRLLEQLKQGKEKEAYDLLQYNPFNSVSWNPKLEEELKRILLYRKTGRFTQEANAQQVMVDTKLLEEATSQATPLFSAIDSLMHNSSSNLSPDLHDLLNGPEAFAAALLNAGWDQAGIQLHALPIIPPNYPEWYAVDVAKAIQQSEGTQKALAFAESQTATPALGLFISEGLIATGNAEAAIEHLNKLKTENSIVGSRSAWLLSLIYIERGQYADAKEVIYDQPKLARDVLGQETLARIALLEGDTEKADAFYTALEEISPEAQSYLARRAFLEKNWNRARELTETLLKQYPNNTLLQENLKKIINEQRR